MVAQGCPLGFLNVNFLQLSQWLLASLWKIRKRLQEGIDNLLTNVFEGTANYLHTIYFSCFARGSLITSCNWPGDFEYPVELLPLQ
jgi:hypothetical protein